MTRSLAATTTALAATLALAGAIGAAGARAAEPLSGLAADLSRTTVSGISSGAYMAGQFHLAFSETVRGAAIIAGGPWGCAVSELDRWNPFSVFASGGSVRALQVCMATTLGEPDGRALAAMALEHAKDDLIDPLSGLAGDRVYLFHGENDVVVRPEVAHEVATFYQAAGLAPADFREVLALDTGDAGHALIVDEDGAACSFSGSPFIVDCDYDQAGSLLSWLYPEMDGARSEPAGDLVIFDQGDFITSPAGYGLADEGAVYIPPACRLERGCAVHIVFHGCLQSRDIEAIGDLFIEATGYREWADANRLILLFPQTSATTAPNACWDWWGHAASDFLSRKAPQLAAVRAMLDRLGEDPG